MSGMQHVHVQMADASTSTSEDREMETGVRRVTGSPTANCGYYNEAYYEYPSSNGSDSAFTFPRPSYGQVTIEAVDDSSCRTNEESVEDLVEEVRIQVEVRYRGFFKIIFRFAHL